MPGLKSPRFQVSGAAGTDFWQSKICRSAPALRRLKPLSAPGSHSSRTQCRYFYEAITDFNFTQPFKVRTFPTHLFIGARPPILWELNQTSSAGNLFIRTHAPFANQKSVI